MARNFSSLVHKKGGEKKLEMETILFSALNKHDEISKTFLVQFQVKRSLSTKTVLFLSCYACSTYSRLGTVLIV